MQLLVCALTVVVTVELPAFVLSQPALEGAGVPEVAAAVAAAGGADGGSDGRADRRRGTAH
jgi:hypothetical protein